MITLPKINNQYSARPKILVAPLDWGLGHATRCIPIIKELLNNTCEVWIAASGDQKALLKEEFPLLSFVEIPGYEIKYGKNRASTLLKLIGSIPKILIRIKQEKEWLKGFLALEKPDAVIADNRYGLYAPGLYSVLITHQLGIKTSFGKIADLILRRVHYRMINRFSRCWVPDFGGGLDSLAGDLSHPGKLPLIPTRYIGPLSRFEKTRPAAGTSGGPEAAMAGGPGARPEGPGAGMPSCDLLILLSGPEPQRTIFERLLLEQLASYPGSAILVRGLPGTSATGPQIPDGAPDRTGKGIPPGVKVYDHLPAKELNVAMAGAGIVISRAGYSTIMDLVKLGKRSILVPTPGQTEQEYLGKYLSGRKVALRVRQSDFSLVDALAKANNFPFTMIGGGGEELLGKEVAALLKCLAGR